MKTETIKAIFTNLLFVIGIGLLIFGFIRGSLTATRLLTFEKYPLNSYEETQCELQYAQPMPAYDAVGKPLPPTENDKQTMEEQKAKCQTALERQRQVKQTEDVVVSVTTLVAGAVLVWSFKRFIFNPK